MQASGMVQWPRACVHLQGTQVRFPAVRSQMPGMAAPSSMVTKMKPSHLNLTSKRACAHRTFESKEHFAIGNIRVKQRHRQVHSSSYYTWTNYLGLARWRYQHALECGLREPNWRTSQEDKTGNTGDTNWAMSLQDLTSPPCLWGLEYVWGRCRP